jgi:hypothetical protein
MRQSKFFIVIGRAVVFPPAKSGGVVLLFLSPELVQKKAVALSDSKRRHMVEKVFFLAF